MSQSPHLPRSVSCPCWMNRGLSRSLRILQLSLPRLHPVDSALIAPQRWWSRPHHPPHHEHWQFAPPRTSSTRRPFRPPVDRWYGRRCPRQRVSASAAACCRLGSAWRGINEAITSEGEKEQRVKQGDTVPNQKDKVNRSCRQRRCVKSWTR